MKHVYPTYYQAFRCIAADCPDSCCQGWDVVIDSDTETFYNSVQGKFGEKLRGAIYTDQDGDRVFRLADEKKCPFWGEDRLCDIYRELGEEHLCLTCAQFPRLKMDYTVFCEHTLALACPEAARLILSTDRAYEDFAEDIEEDCEDYDAQVMRRLLKIRKKCAELLTADQPLKGRLEELLSYVSQAQRELTGFEIGYFPPSLREIMEECEYIDEGNRELFALAAEDQANDTRFEKELTRLALYYLYRYFLGAIDGYDIVAVARFLIGSVQVIGNLAERCGDIVTAAQLYSKEIEQSYENMERMWELFASY